MAYTYHVEIKETGGSVTRYTGISPTEYAVTGLAGSQEHQWRVRQVDDTSGALSWSAWSAWTTFTTSAATDQFVSLTAATDTSTAGTLTAQVVTDTTDPVITITGANPYLLPIGDTYTELGATATDDTDGDLTGSISTSGTVDNNTQGIYQIQYQVTDAAGNTATAIREVHVATPLTPSTYNLEWRVVGQGATAVNGITDTFYTLTGLNQSTDYEWRVQGADAGKTSAWTGWQSFQSLADNTPVTATLINTSDTGVAEAITVSLEGSVDLSLTVAIDTGTVSSLTASLTGGGGGEVAPDLWDVEVENLITNVVTSFTNLSQSQMALTWPAHTDFRWRVRGKNGADASEWSAWTSAHITNALPDLASSVESGGGTLDVFEIIFPDLVTGDDNTDLFGLLNDSTAQIELTINGTTYYPINKNGSWRIAPFGSRLGRSQLDELTVTQAWLLAGDMQITGTDGFKIL